MNEPSNLNGEVDKVLLEFGAKERGTSVTYEEIEELTGIVRIVDGKASAMWNQLRKAVKDKLGDSELELITVPNKGWRIALADETLIRVIHRMNRHHKQMTDSVKYMHGVRDEEIDENYQKLKDLLLAHAKESITSGKKTAMTAIAYANQPRMPLVRASDLES